jgi:hypothetical protein
VVNFAAYGKYQRDIMRKRGVPPRTCDLVCFRREDSSVRNEEAKRSDQMGMVRSSSQVEESINLNFNW